MENLRYKKISTFLSDLNNREKKYICKKLNKEILQNEVLKVAFTVNGEKLVNS
jgi:hypothetical protein